MLEELEKLAADLMICFGKKCCGLQAEEGMMGVEEKEKVTRRRVGCKKETDGCLQSFGKAKHKNV